MCIRDSCNNSVYLMVNNLGILFAGIAFFVINKEPAQSLGSVVKIPGYNL